MLSEFLRESSIHGLRYLVEARLGIVRLLWLVSISSCFTFAVVIIYLNVHNWQNSPAVVTSIQPESIEVVNYTSIYDLLCCSMHQQPLLILNRERNVSW